MSRNLYIVVGHAQLAHCMTWLDLTDDGEISFDDINLESGQAFCAKNWSMEAVQVTFCVDIGVEATRSCLQASERCHQMTS